MKRKKETQLQEEKTPSGRSVPDILYENTGYVTFVLDDSGMIRRMDPSVQKLTGFRPSELSGKHIKKMVPMKEMHRVLDTLSHVLSGNVLRYFRMNLMSSSGSIIPVEVSMTPILSADSLMHIECAVRSIEKNLKEEEDLREIKDKLEKRIEERTSKLRAANIKLQKIIIENKKTEAALRVSEKNFRTLAESLRVLIYKADPETLNTTYVNRYVTSLYGYTAREWISDPSLWEKTIYPDDRNRVFASMAHAKKNMKNIVLEYRIKRKDGAVRWVTDHVSWEKDHMGRLMSIDGLVMDVTDHKSLADALLQSERKLRLMIEAVADGITVTDMTGHIIDLNEAAARMYGVKRKEELIGKEAFVFISHGDIERARSNMEKTLIEGRVMNVEYMLKRKNGSEYPAELSASLLRDISGQPSGFVAIIRDLSDKKKMEEEKEVIRSRVLQTDKMSAIGQLAGGVAHEINNPLTEILANAQLILKDMKKDHLWHGEITDIVEAAKRCKGITADLLKFSRPYIYKFLKSDIALLIEKSLQLCRKEISLDNIKIVKKYGKDVPPVPVSQGHLQQVFLNLLLNAKDAMPWGGIIRISTSLCRDTDIRRNDLDPKKEYIKVILSDTGIGMNRAGQEKIFEPFNTTKPHGTGLGLYVVYGIVKKHGGKIFAHSEGQGKGMSFFIYLPK